MDANILKARRYVTITEKSYQQILRELREDYNFSQTDVAKVLHTSQQMYYRYENGECEMPIRHLKALCMLYEVSADDVLFQCQSDVEYITCRYFHYQFTRASYFLSS